MPVLDKTSFSAFDKWLIRIDHEKDQLIRFVANAARSDFFIGIFANRCQIITAGHIVMSRVGSGKWPDHALFARVGCAGIRGSI